MVCKLGMNGTAVQAVEHAYAVIGRDKFKYAGFRVERKQPGFRRLGMLIDVALHLHEGADQLPRDLVSEPGRDGGFLGVAFFLYQGLGEELVPREDRGIITVRLTGPDGVGLDHMDRQVENAENIVRPLIEQGVADRLYSITGRYDFNRGQIDLPLVAVERCDC